MELLKINLASVMSRLTLCLIVMTFMVASMSDAKTKSRPRLEALRSADFVNYSHLCFELDSALSLVNVQVIPNGSKPTFTVTLRGVNPGVFSQRIPEESEFINSIDVSYNTKSRIQVATVTCDPNVDLSKMVWHQWDAMVTVDLPLKEPNYLVIPHPERIKDFKASKHEPTKDYGKVVIIDPGHGGWNSNATGNPRLVGANPLHEKDVVLDLGLRLKELLDADPRFLPIMTRYGDYLPIPFGFKGTTKSHQKNIALDHRVTLANEYKGDIFISLHVNAAPTLRQQRDANGFEIFYINPQKASSIKNFSDSEYLQASTKEQKDILSLLSSESIPVNSQRLAVNITNEIKKISWLALRPRTIVPKGYRVLTHLYMPTVLAEYAFITHPRDHANLRQSSKRDELVMATYNAIQKFFFESESFSSELIATYRGSETLDKIKAAPPKPRYHKVRSGESLSSIASKYGLSLTSLRNANRNKISSRSTIRKGITLTIPSSSKIASKPRSSSSSAKKITYTVRSGDTLGKIASRYRTTAEAIMLLNNKKSTKIMPGSKLKVYDRRVRVASARAVQRLKTHRVKSGETLGTIANRYKMSWKSIKSLNRIRGTVIQKGQLLRLR